MSNNRMSTYTRFIPGDELQEVESWTFDAFNDEVAHRGAPETRRPDHHLFGHKPQSAVDPSTLPGYQEGQQAGHAVGYDEGLSAGLKQLTLYKEQQGQALAQRINSVAQQFTQQLQGLEQQLADAVVDIAVDLARQVVRTQLKLDPQAVIPVAWEAVHSIVAPAGQLILRAHPDDVDMLREQLLSSQDGRTLVLRGDPAIAPGGCIVESEHGSVDGSLPTRWSRAVAGLGRPDAPLETAHDNAAAQADAQTPMGEPSVASGLRAEQADS